MRCPRIEKLESRRLLVSDWQNSWKPLDVNGDDSITPLDALLGINRLNRHSSATLSTRSPNSTEPFYDTNGDGLHSPIDVLIVVNSLNGGIQVGAGLKNDTGLGPHAASDRLTSDPTIQGAVQGTVTTLRARVDDGVWTDISQSLNAGRFELSPSLLDTLAGAALTDGRHRVDVEASDSSDSSGVIDRSFVQFDLDRSSPTAKFAGAVLMTSPDTVVVPFSEPAALVPVSLNQVRVYDITWGEKASGNTWDEDGNYPRFPVLVQSAKLSDDGLSMTIKFAGVSRSAKYLIELNDVVQDKAGNHFQKSPTSDASTFKANTFASDDLPLIFGKSYRSVAIFDPRVVEYQFQLQTAQTLLWSGNVFLGGGSRYELYDRFGNLVRQFLPGTITNPGDASRPTLISLTAGDYRLRVVDPPAGFGFFRVYAAASLPPLPIDRASGNLDSWPLDAYTVDLAAGERLYVESLDQQTALRNVFDPLGNVVSLKTNGWNQFFDAPHAGKYVVLANRIGFRSFHSTRQTIEVSDANVPIEGELSSPGARLNISIDAVPGEITVISAQTAASINWSVRWDDGMSIEKANDLWFVRPASRKLVLQLERIDGGTAGEYHFQLKKLSNASLLPIGEWTGEASTADYQWYRLPHDATVLMDGNYRAMSVEDGPYSLAVEPNAGRTLIPNPSHVGSDRYVGIQNGLSQTRWRALLPETKHKTLSFDSLNPIHFESGLETVDFSFAGAPDEFIDAQFDAAADSPFAKLRPSLELIDPTGRKLPALSEGLWRIERPGTHRLLVHQNNGVTISGDIELEAHRNSAWPELQVHHIESVDAGSRRLFAIPGSFRSLILIPDNDNFTPAQMKIFDDASRMLATENLFHDKWIDLPAEPSYFLLIDNSAGLATFKFEGADSPLTSINAQVDQTVTVPLTARGDRVRLEYELKRGERISGFRFDSDGKIRTALLGPDMQPVSEVDNWYGSGPYVFTVQDSGTYTLEIRNASSEATNFQVLLKDSPLPSLGHALAGVGTVYSGQLQWTDANQGVRRFPIEVESNTALMLDWLDEYENNRFKIDVRDANGEAIVSLSSGWDSDIFLLSNAGFYTVELSTYEQETPLDYRFVLRDLSAAPVVNPGDSIDSETVQPFEAKLFRLHVPAVADLQLSQHPDRVIPALLRDVFEGSSVPVHSSIDWATLAAGDHAVLVPSLQSVATAVSFSTLIADHHPLLTLNSDNRVLLNVGSSAYQFKTTAPDSQVKVSISITGATVRVWDMHEREVVADPTGLFFLPQAGTYRMTVTLPAGTPSQTANVELIAVPPHPRSYTLGTFQVETDLHPGQLVRYSMEVPTDGIYVWRCEGGKDYELRDENDRLVALSQGRNNEGLFTGPRAVQFLKAGKVVLQFDAVDSHALFSLSRLTDLPQIGLGTTSGKFAAGEVGRIYRFDLAAGQPIVLSALPGALVSFMSENMESPNSIVRPTAVSSNVDQCLLVFVLPASQDQATGNDFSFTVAAALHSIELPLAIGGNANGELIPYQNLKVTFTVDKAGQLLSLGSDLNHMRLTIPDGRSRFLDLQATGVAWLVLPVGEYELTASAESDSLPFQISLLPVADAILLSNEFAGIVSADQLYSIEVPERETISWQILAGDHPAWRDFTWWDADGVPISAKNDQGQRLSTGRYFFMIHESRQTQPPLVYQLTLNRVERQIIVGSFGREITVQTAAPSEAVIQYIVSAGDLVDCPWQVSSSGEIVWFRIIPRGAQLGDYAAWRLIQDWSSPQSIQQDGTIEFLSAGTGSSGIKLVKLQQAALLDSSHAGDAVQPAELCRSMWRFIPTVGKAYRFELSESPDTSGRWWFTDGSGRSLASIADGETLSFGSSQEVYLIFETIHAMTNIDLRVRISEVTAAR